MRCLLQIAGCPILARSVRKSGIPPRSHPWDFLALGLLMAAVTLLSACRIDMHVQPRQNPLSRSDFFPDQRSERPPVEGTVARGQLHEDTYFYTGKLGNNSGDYLPFPVSKEVLERGRERYNIFCAPCHSQVGDGNGFIPPAASRASRRRITSRGCRKPPWAISTMSSPTASASCPTTLRRFRPETAGTSWPTFVRCS